jgi:hypothetical protein
MFKPIATAFALCLATSTAFAAQTKTYQVTGPVLELSDAAIVVQKGKEKWEIARTADSKVTGELKVGAKVTIEYRMTAATIEVKGAAKGAKAEAPAAPADHAAAAKPAK